MKVRWFVFVSILLVVLIIIPSGCWRDFSDDPIKWSFVSGDGSWDSSSRKWSAYFSPGETRSAIIRLSNTGSENLWVLVVVDAPNFMIGNLEGTFVPPSGNVLNVPPLGSAEFKITMTADSIGAPGGSHKYELDFGSSTNEKINPVGPLENPT